MRLSILERKILNSIQIDLPLNQEPFKELSKKLKIKEEELVARIRRLKEKGIIRNFSAGINHRKLGFRSTLLALKVPEEKIEAVAGRISAYPQVTHCFLREGEYNLWTVLIYKNGLLERFLKRFSKELGPKSILNLTTKRQFKLKTTFKI
ncbi:MAG TPA: Lrp/AsnC family transcriptional regulator [Candidatus Omnitrophota bacterium]|nr:Lrp/AsnC family transcriptional regulator [Candidatus Omnitrophota bacterium]